MMSKTFIWKEMTLLTELSQFIACLNIVSADAFTKLSQDISGHGIGLIDWNIIEHENDGFQFGLPRVAHKI